MRNAAGPSLILVTLREISLRMSPRYRSHAPRLFVPLVIFGRGPVRAMSPSALILDSRNRNSIELAFSELRCAVHQLCTVEPDAGRTAMVGRELR